MKHTVVSIVLLISLASLGAVMNHGWEWASSIANPGTNLISPGGIATSPVTGYSFVAGEFEGTATFGATTLTSAGNWDAYVGCIDPAGVWQWAVRVGAAGPDGARDIACSTAGFVYVCGEFSGTASFGSTTLTSAGYRDAFIAKLDADGNWLWAVRGGGIYVDSCLNLSLKHVIFYLDEVYVTGYFEGTAAFGSTTLTSQGARDLFVGRLGSDGSWNWAVRAGGSGIYEIPSDICRLGSNLFIAGSFTGSAGFGSTTLTANGDWGDGFIAKLDNDGNWIWALHCGGTDTSGPGAICTDGANIYVTGSFEGSLTLGATTLSSHGAYDGFAGRISPDGAWLWALGVGGSGDDYCYDALADSSAGAFVTGSFSNSVTFGSTTLASAGSADIFVMKLSAAGAHIWTKQAGGIGFDAGNFIARDPARERYYVTGLFGNTALFDGHPVTNQEGNWDVYVARLDEYEVCPLAPQNLSLTMTAAYEDDPPILFYNETLTWDPVSLDTHGRPVTPDTYRIYYWIPGWDSYHWFGSTQQCQWTHNIQGDTQPAIGFYKIVAEKY